MSAAESSEVRPVDIVVDLRSWCADMHSSDESATCLFCGAASQIERHRQEIKDLTRLATQATERDVQMYVNRLVHRYRSTAFGRGLATLITWSTVSLR